MKFEYRLVPLHLAHLDEAQSDTLVLYFFEDERPLKDLAGLVDWRLNGKLTSFLLDNRVTGAFRECTLYPVPARLPIAKLLLIGLGDRRGFNGGKFQIVTSFTMDTLRKLGVADFALAFPRKPYLKISVRQVLEIWMTECRLRLLTSHQSQISTTFVIEKDDHNTAQAYIQEYLREYVASTRER